MIPGSYAHDSIVLFLKLRGIRKSILTTALGGRIGRLSSYGAHRRPTRSWSIRSMRIGRIGACRRSILERSFRLVVFGVGPSLKVQYGDLYWGRWCSVRAQRACSNSRQHNGRIKRIDTLPSHYQYIVVSHTMASQLWKNRRPRRNDAPVPLFQPAGILRIYLTKVLHPALEI